jgi:L-asparagine transporter-like permease
MLRLDFGMRLIFILAFIAFIVWAQKRGRDLTAERAASGQLRSPLYWAGNGLVLLLLALTFSIMIIHHRPAHVPNFLWIAVLGNVVALLFVRRAVEWRYPYV